MPDSARERYRIANRKGKARQGRFFEAPLRVWPAALGHLTACGPKSVRTAPRNFNTSYTDLPEASNCPTPFPPYPKHPGDDPGVCPSGQGRAKSNSALAFGNTS